MKTAVQWLIEKLEEEKLIFNHSLVERWKQQALEMETNQSKDCFVEKVILKDGYRACCGKEMTDDAAEKYCKDVWLKT